jgi:uncharacterized protein YdeI (BOF family)
VLSGRSTLARPLPVMCRRRVTVQRARHRHTSGLAIVTASLIAVTLAGCGGSSANDQAQPAPSPTGTPPTTPASNAGSSPATLPTPDASNLSPRSPATVATTTVAAINAGHVANRGKVVLRGRALTRIDADEYLFADGTGQLRLDLETDTVQALPLNKLVWVTGVYDRDDREVDVTRWTAAS